MSPRSFVSPRHKSRGNPRSRTGLQIGPAIGGEGGERPVIKVYLSTRYVTMHQCVFFHIDMFSLPAAGLFSCSRLRGTQLTTGRHSEHVVT